MSGFAEGYRNLFGGGQSPWRLYGGFVAFFMGFTMGLIGILVAVSGDFLLQEVWRSRGLGITIAALGTPLIFMGLQLTLPSRGVIHAVAGVGTLVCVAGVFLFNQAWPDQWNRPDVDRSAQVIGVYTLGMVLLVTTTAMALVVNFVSRIVFLSRGEHEVDLFSDPERPVTMEEVLRDIEREVAKQKLTWGGLVEDRLPREFLKLKADFGPGAQISKGGPGKITRTKTGDLDVAFDALSRLRGIEGKQVADEEDVVVAIEALSALKRARQARMERSLWYRFKRSVVSLFTGGKDPVEPSVHPSTASTYEIASEESGSDDPGSAPRPVRVHGSKERPAPRSGAKRPHSVKRSPTKTAPSASKTGRTARKGTGRKSTRKRPVAMKRSHR